MKKLLLALLVAAAVQPAITLADTEHVKTTKASVTVTEEFSVKDETVKYAKIKAFGNAMAKRFKSAGHTVSDGSKKAWHKVVDTCRGWKNKIKNRYA